MGESFGGKNKVGRELIYTVRDELRPPVESSYSSEHPLLRREIFEDPGSKAAEMYFRVQDPVQLSSSGQLDVSQEVFVGELSGMCTREEMINKQLTSTANDFERLAGMILNEDLEARIVNEFLTVKSFQRSDASRVFHKELVRPVVWCRMVVRRLLVYFVEADRANLSYLYKRPLGQEYKYIDIYNFLRDRLRAVWQDLTVQHATRHRASIDSFEVSFRFLLLSEECLCNLKEFNSVQNGSLMSTCLDKLMSGYMDVLYYRKKSSETGDSDFSRILVYDSPFQAEFWSYRILTSMSIHIKDANDNRIMDIINAFSPEMIQHPLVKLSLGIHSSFRLVNIVRYFRYFRKCFSIILDLIQYEDSSKQSPQNPIKDKFRYLHIYPRKDRQDLDQYRQFGHALILICVLIKKYSNIIRLKYLNILLSSNMSKRQLMPLSSFIEIFGFYIESLESLKLFAERFNIKIVNRDDPGALLFQESSQRPFQSIDQVLGASAKFVVSFKDCINLSTMESLSILNSLSWPSELLVSLFERIPRIDILDPIFEKPSKAVLELGRIADDTNHNKNQTAGPDPNKMFFASLSSQNRDLINGSYGGNRVSNTIIQNLRDIDINKAVANLKHSTDSTNKNKRKGFCLEDELFSVSQPENHGNIYPNPSLAHQTSHCGGGSKRRSLTKNDAPPTPDSTSLQDPYSLKTPEALPPESLATFQVAGSRGLSAPPHIHTNFPTARQTQEIGTGAKHAHVCAGNFREESEVVEKEESCGAGCGHDEGVPSKRRVELPLVEDGAGLRGCGVDDEKTEFENDLLVEARRECTVRDSDSSITGFVNQVIEEGLVGLSGWRHFRVFFNKYQSQNVGAESDTSERQKESSLRRVNMLLSRLTLPESESGINLWLGLSVSGILEHVKTDIISRVLKSLKFSFVFFYNQLASLEGVSRSHVSQLSTFYTKLELILSNLTNRDFLGGGEDSAVHVAGGLNQLEKRDFAFPWSSVVVRSELLPDRERGKIIIDMYQVDFSHDSGERLQDLVKCQIPVHVEMLSVWQSNARTCLRSQLLSDEDVSMLGARQREGEEGLQRLENQTLERVIYEYLTTSGDVIVWTLPFLVRAGDEESRLVGTEASANFEEDSSSEYMRRSLDAFAFEVSSERGREQLIGEFESCCRVLSIGKYPAEEVRSRIPILKTVTIFLSFVAYVPSTHFALANGGEDFQQRLGNEIKTLERRFEEIILKEHLHKDHVLVISNDAVSGTSVGGSSPSANVGGGTDEEAVFREPVLISNYSGMSCNLKFKCIGIAPFELLQDSARKQDRISIYAPGLNSLINTKLSNKSFPNNLVVSNGHGEYLEIEPTSFLSTMWLHNFYKGPEKRAKPNASFKSRLHTSFELALLKETFKRGFIECFRLFTNGNIDWILVSGNCSYAEIKGIIVWIYDLYVHSMVCLEEDSPSLVSLSLGGGGGLSGMLWDLRDPCKVRDSCRGVLRHYEKWIKFISDSLGKKYGSPASLKVLIPKVIWNVLFDHQQPVKALSLALSDSTLLDHFSSLMLFRRELEKDDATTSLEQQDKTLLDSEELLSRMDTELFKYKTFNYLNRFKLEGEG